MHPNAEQSVRSALNFRRELVCPPLDESCFTESGRRGCFEGLGAAELPWVAVHEQRARVFEAPKNKSAVWPFALGETRARAGTASGSSVCRTLAHP